MRELRERRLSELEIRKRQRGILGYDDLLTRLKDALAVDDSRGATADAHQRWPIVMVDEFQDTDPVQWEVIRRAFTTRSTLILMVTRSRRSTRSAAGTSSPISAPRTQSAGATEDTGDQLAQRRRPGAAPAGGPAGRRTRRSAVIVHPVEAQHGFTPGAPRPTHPYGSALLVSSRSVPPHRNQSDPDQPAICARTSPTIWPLTSATCWRATHVRRRADRRW